MKNRLCPNIQLIFDGKILQNTSRFARLQTAEGMRPRETLVFIVFSSSKRKDTNQPFIVIQPKKIAEQVRLLGYYDINPKVFVRRDWFGLCENSHNAKTKN